MNKKRVPLNAVIDGVWINGVKAPAPLIPVRAGDKLALCGTPDGALKLVVTPAPTRLRRSGTPRR